MNWRRMMLAGALVGGSIWCLGLVQQVHSEQVTPSPSRREVQIQPPIPESKAVVGALNPAAGHPGRLGPIAGPG